MCKKQLNTLSQMTSHFHSR